MRDRTRLVGAFLLASLLAAPALAVDFETKWRIGLAFGGHNPADEIESQAGNQFAVLDPCLRNQTCTGESSLLLDVFVDPRADLAAFGNLDVNSALLSTLSVQYGVTKTFVLEGSVGYQKSDVGDVEVSAQFFGELPPIAQQTFAFSAFRVTAGELERMPIQLTAIGRFRPRASFNPYVAVGVGYSIIGFEPSDEFNQLSIDIDNAIGEQQRLTSALLGFPSIVDDATSGPAPLEGATVDARDSFEWHFGGGAEYSFKRKWHAFVDVRWTDASRDLGISFNGQEGIGIGVPQFTDFADSALANSIFGPVRVGSIDIDGADVEVLDPGIIDGGQLLLLPIENAPPNTNCELDPEDPNCQLDFLTNAELLTDPRLADDFVPDGELDPGSYYVQGGRMSYDGFSAQFGVRFTF